MSEQKPKKDLRARLGRTISPQTPGAPPIAAPGGIVPPAADAPPGAAPVAAPVAAPPVAAPPVAAPAIAAPPIAAPPAASKTPFGGADIAPPPFAKPAEPAPKAAPKRAADPFAAAAVVPQEVRIAMDEKPVDDAEVGRRQTGRVFVVIAAGLTVGVMLGGGVGTMNARRRLYNETVTDGHAIYTAVDTASHGVLEAQQHIEALATAAGGGTSGQPSVNYEELAALAALPDPLPASAFSERNYNAFQPGAVDDLFTYYNNIHTLWRQFAHLNEIAAGPAQRPPVDEIAAISVCPVTLGHDQASARAAMDAAAAATATAASAQYVAALSSGADGVHAALRFAEPAMDAQHQPTGGILMHAGPTEAGTPVELWTPETAITATPDHAIIVNGANSAGVLSERLGAFRSYVQALQETRQLMTSTIEVQGRLTTALGDIARLEEVPAF